MTAAPNGSRVARVSPSASDTLAMPQTPAPDATTPEGGVTVPVSPQRRALRKHTRTRPGRMEQARREAWGRKWGALNRAVINQTMKGTR